MAITFENNSTYKRNQTKRSITTRTQKPQAPVPSPTLTPQTDPDEITRRFTSGSIVPPTFSLGSQGDQYVSSTPGAQAAQDQSRVNTAAQADIGHFNRARADRNANQPYYLFGGGNYVSSTPGAQQAAQDFTEAGDRANFLSATRNTGAAVFGGFDPQAGEGFQGAVDLIASGDITAGYAQLPNFMSADMATMVGLPQEWYSQLYNPNGTLKPLSDLTGGGGLGGGSGGGGGFGGGGRRSDGLIGRPWRYGLIQWRI